MYVEVEGHQFLFFDCWKEFLSKSQTWDVHVKVAKDKKKKKEAKPKDAEKRKLSDDEGVDDEPSSKRPIGVKKAKEEEAFARKLEQERQKDPETLKEQIHVNRERLDLMRERHDWEIMSKDLTGLDDDTRWYFQTLKQEVVARMKEKSNASGANTDASPLLAGGTDDSGAASDEKINEYPDEQ